MNKPVGFFGCEQQKQTLVNQKFLLEGYGGAEGKGVLTELKEKGRTEEIKLKSHAQKGRENRIWVSGRDSQMVSSRAINHFQFHFHFLKSKIPKKELCDGLDELA